MVHPSLGFRALTSEEQTIGIPIIKTLKLPAIITAKDVVIEGAHGVEKIMQNSLYTKLRGVYQWGILKSHPNKSRVKYCVGCYWCGFWSGPVEVAGTGSPDEEWLGWRKSRGWGIEGVFCILE